MVRFFRGSPLHRGRLGIYPGAFNPVTTAHLAVARAAGDQHRLNQVVFLLPQVFPHKEYGDAPFEERLALLEAAIEKDPTLAVASSEGGLFIEIAREFRAECGEGVEIFLLCGRDAAERIVNWGYGEGPAFARQLEEFQMLVASREGEYRPPPEFSTRILAIRMPRTYSEISSSAVRAAIRAGGAWENLVPEAVARRIRERGLYAG